MFIRLIILSFIILLGSSTCGEVLNCVFDIIEDWDHYLQNPYSCEGTPVNFYNRVTFDRLESTHTGNRENDDVTAFIIYDETCAYFPRGIEKFFKNLRGIAIQKSHLKVISERDLQPFPELISLSLYGNELTSLEYDLFKHNSKLKTISFYDNSITSIAEDIFKHVKNLDEAFFENNKCVNAKAENSYKLRTLESIIIGNCKVTEDMKTIRELKEEIWESSGNANTLQQVRDELYECSSNLKMTSDDRRKCESSANTCKEQLSKCNSSKTQTKKYLINCQSTAYTCEENLLSCNSSKKKTETDLDNCQSTANTCDGNLSSCKSLKKQIETDLANCQNVKRSTEDELTSAGDQLTKCLHNNTKTLENLKKCLSAENIPSTTSITISCKNFDGKACTSSCLDIQKEGMEITGIRLPDGTKVSPDIITELTMYGYGIQYLPINIGKFFRNLKKMSIDQTEVEAIDKNLLKDLSKLTELKMSNGKLSIIKSNTFTGIPKIQKIDFSGNMLTNVDEILTAPLTKLEKLNLNKNQISEIDFKIIDSLPRSMSLQLDQNDLRFVSSIDFLKKATSFSLKENKCVNMQYPEDNFDDIAETIKYKCPFKTELWCDFEEDEDDYVCNANKIKVSHENTDITKVTGRHLRGNKFTEVTKFKAENQDIQYIPNNFNEEFFNVVKVEIISCRLKKLFLFSELIWVRIVGNDLHDIDDAYFYQSPLIEFLDISNNKIQKFPEHFFEDLVNIKELNIEENQLIDLRWSSFKYLENLEILHAKNNKIKSIEWCWNDSNIKYMDLKGNACVNEVVKNKNKDSVLKNALNLCYVEVSYKD